MTYDPSNLGFVPAGSATSALLPDVPIGVTSFDGQPGRIVVLILSFRRMPVEIPRVARST